jgi:hypothetical protein
MTDDEYLSWVEKRVRASFAPSFGGATFFNRELFEHVLDQAGRGTGVLDRHMANFNSAQAGMGRRAKLRVDDAARTIKLKVYTPSAARKVTITRDGVAVRPMALDE